MKKAITTLISIDAYLDVIGRNTEEIKENIKTSIDELNQALNLASIIFSEAEVCELKKSEYERGVDDGKVIAEHGTTNWQT